MTSRIYLLQRGDTGAVAPKNGSWRENASAEDLILESWSQGFVSFLSVSQWWSGCRSHCLSSSVALFFMASTLAVEWFASIFNMMAPSRDVELSYALIPPLAFYQHTKPWELLDGWRSHHNGMYHSCEHETGRAPSQTHSRRSKFCNPFRAMP